MSLQGLADYHMHTTLCGHASGTIDEYVRQAVQLGFDEIGFSDHIYLYHLPPDERDPELAMREDQMHLYVRMVEDARSRYPEIAVRLGLEADYIAGQTRTLSRILRAFTWDYVYGSVHFIDGWGFDDPRYEVEYSEWKTDDLYIRYFTEVMDAARTGLFDVMAHLDLVKKFGYRASFDLTQLYAEVAQVLSQSGVCIEISSGGLRQRVEEYYPQPDLLRACYLAGVPVTFGSDAHRPEHVGYAFPQLVSALKESGYTQMVRFQNRERTLHPLPDLPEK